MGVQIGGPRFVPTRKSGLTLGEQKNDIFGFHAGNCPSSECPKLSEISGKPMTKQLIR